ncbi:MAG: hypothetical protein J0L72_02925 [Armatimonadetes bacterium]|nr:hypothetical protein [Armatimonadota bacterium]
MLAGLVLANLISSSNMGDWSFDYQSRSGLKVVASDVNIVQGSFFQYYAPGWTKGYYSSNWDDQVITRTPEGTRVTFGNPNSAASGTIDFRRVGNALIAEYELAWNSDDPCMIEASFGHLWAPAFLQGTVQTAGVTARTFTKPPVPSATPEARQIGSPSNQFAFKNPLLNLNVSVKGANPLLFDARQYSGDFAVGKQLWWFGDSEIPVSRSFPAKFRVEYQIETAKSSPSQSVPVEAKPKVANTALVPAETKLPLIPKPKSYAKRSGTPLAISWKKPQLGRDQITGWEAATSWLKSRFEVIESAGVPISFKKDSSIVSEGYRLSVDSKSATITASEPAGFKFGLMRLANLTFTEKGKLSVEPCIIEDRPSIHFRGLHTFVGPRAIGYQSRLIQNLMNPMMMNRVVLQCERTAWESTPGTNTGITMSKQQLTSLVTKYQEAGIRPIPLIQSFGHMGWLFENGKNLDIALNPQVPFTIDPNKPRSREVLEGIWNEALEIFNPDIAHFGLDEVNLRGMSTDSKTLTNLWRIHVPWLASYAQKKGVKMMLWGDNLLAPGQAPDATNGTNPEEAKRRREVLPKGAIIADWHYINNADPKIYRSIDLFKSEGFDVVASTWNRPQNIQGFFKAAELAGSGALQTTWAGYESNLDNMLRARTQFSAYALAAEHAWSGEKPSYDLNDAFKRLYFAERLPLNPRKGNHWILGKVAESKRIGNVNFELLEPLNFYCPLTEVGKSSPKIRTITVAPHRASAFSIAFESKFALGDHDQIARVTVIQASGQKSEFKVNYCTHVTAPDDSQKPLAAFQVENIAAPVFKLETNSEIKSIEIECTNPSSGLILRGITTW